MKNVRAQTKRILSIVLAMAMLAMCVPLAFADNTAYRVGDQIQFGSFPQSKIPWIGNSELIKGMNAAIKNATWKSYEYYAGTRDATDTRPPTDTEMMVPSDYMKFIDFFYRGEKYRAVKIDKYRPNSTYYIPMDDSYVSGTYFREIPCNNQYREGYRIRDIEFFKYEPLVWRILDPATGLVMCENIIDSQPFQNEVYKIGSTYYQDADAKNYANNYATSSIRDWLNDDFYNTAFSDEQKRNLKITPITDLAPTNDKIFLLSCDDAVNCNYGFNASKGKYDEARQTVNKATDYAKCQNLWEFDSAGTDGFSAFGVCNWWLRTPYGYSKTACVVSGADGTVCAWSSNKYQVNLTTNGVRPVCCLNNLTSDSANSIYLYSEQNYHEHKFDTTVTEAATCTNLGKSVSICECGLTKQITFAIIDHSQTLQNQKETTCIEDGYTGDWVCSMCGRVFEKGKSIAAFGHVDSDNDGHCDRCNRYMTGGTHCIYCGKIHNGTFGWLIKFFHTIKHKILVRLFGLKEEYSYMDT